MTHVAEFKDTARQEKTKPKNVLIPFDKRAKMLIYQEKFNSNSKEVAYQIPF